jgi:hypothetical protein
MKAFEKEVLELVRQRVEAGTSKDALLSWIKLAPEVESEASTPENVHLCRA